MPKLIIIGNGFDQSHGLKTSYKDFIKWVLDQGAKTLQKYAGHHKGRDLKRVNNLHKYEGFDNGIIGALKEASSTRWCDAEEIYYDHLQRVIDSHAETHFDDIDELNQAMSNTTWLLNAWIADVMSSEPFMMRGYSELLKKLSSQHTFYLNYNYTNLLLRYVKPGYGNLLNIHGQFNSDTEPVIFGYSPKQSEYDKLRTEKDPRLLRYMKRQLYSETGALNTLSHFLEIQPKSTINLVIIGHSCGPSDWNTLEMIVNSPCIKSIRIVFFNREDRLGQVARITQMARNDISIERMIAPINTSLRMPQHDEDQDIYIEDNRELMNSIATD